MCEKNLSSTYLCCLTVLPKLPVTAVRTSLSIWYFSLWSKGRIFSKTLCWKTEDLMKYYVSSTDGNKPFYFCDILPFWLWRFCSELRCLLFCFPLSWCWSCEWGPAGRRAAGDTEGPRKTNPGERTDSESDRTSVLTLWTVVVLCWY